MQITNGIIREIRYLEFRLALAKSLTGFDIVNQENEQKMEITNELCKSDIIRRCKICWENGRDSKTPYYFRNCKEFMHEKCFNSHL